MREGSRHYVMCPPIWFDVSYAINPWMDPTVPVDRPSALAQWETLRQTYLRIGHRVDLLEPQPDLPDMVFTANGALVIGDRALCSRFRDSVRAAESFAHSRWLSGYGVRVVTPDAVNEGEGDFAWTGTRILAGHGFRSTEASHAEVARVFNLPVISLELVDPRFYHLDTALAVLGTDVIAYYPPAFSERSRQTLATLYPDAIIATDADAEVLGLNAVSDGTHVVLAAQAETLADEIDLRGFTPVPVDVSELRKAGGGVKCATLEVHPDPQAETSAVGHPPAQSAAPTGIARRETRQTRGTL